MKFNTSKINLEAPTVRRLERTKKIKQCNHLHYKIYLTQNIQRSHAMDVPGIESWLVRDFPHPSRPDLGPIQPAVQVDVCLTMHH